MTDDVKLPAHPQAPAIPDAEYPEAAQVCAQTYQVVGSLLSDLGVLELPQSQHVMDNLSQHRLVHDDVLPWPSFERTIPADVLSVLREARDRSRLVSLPLQLAYAKEKGWTHDQFEAWYTGVPAAIDAYLAKVAPQPDSQPPAKEGEQHG
jgi:hypothetical protein